jgi:hypothetical protein
MPKCQPLAFASKKKHGIAVNPELIPLEKGAWEAADKRHCPRQQE